MCMCVCIYGRKRERKREKEREREEKIETLKENTLASFMVLASRLEKDIA